MLNVFKCLSFGNQLALALNSKSLLTLVSRHHTIFTSSKTQRSSLISTTRKLCHEKHIRNLKPSLRLRISEILEKEEHSEKVVTINGWVKNLRVQGGGDFAFIDLNDGSSFSNLQIIIDKSIKGFERLISQYNGLGSCIKVKGLVCKSQGKKQSVELQVTNPQQHELVILGESDASEYKIFKSKEKMKFEYLREISHLRPRTTTFSSILSIRNSLFTASHKFFQELGFKYVSTPIITDSDCEGAGELFQVTTLHQDKKEVKDFSEDFFGKQAFLTVSGQLALENYACGMGDVYTFGPTFRAEKSHTTRHLAEFWMLEPEISFADLNDITEYSEAYIKYCIAYILDRNSKELTFLNNNLEKSLIQRLEAIEKEKFVKISYTEAIAILNKEVEKKKKLFNGEKLVWGDDLSTEHEKFLTEHCFNKIPVIVTDYPKDIKSFYMKLNDDEKTVRAMDLLVPKIGEIIGGSQREEDYTKLVKAMDSKGLDKKRYWWYLDLRKFGTSPHAGFGVGFERLVMLCTGVENIKDVIPFPRSHKSLDF